MNKATMLEETSFSRSIVALRIMGKKVESTYLLFL